MTSIRCLFLGFPLSVFVCSLGLVLLYIPCFSYLPNKQSFFPRARLVSFPRVSPRSRQESASTSHWGQTPPYPVCKLRVSFDFLSTLPSTSPWVSLRTFFKFTRVFVLNKPGRHVLDIFTICSALFVNKTCRFVL